VLSLQQTWTASNCFELPRASGNHHGERGVRGAAVDDAVDPGMRRW
jgi:hypothetical protein